MRITAVTPLPSAGHSSHNCCRCARFDTHVETCTYEIKGTRSPVLGGARTELLDRCGMQSNSTNFDPDQKNGVGEQTHYRFEGAIDQAL